jgi:hypothetical protein
MSLPSLLVGSIPRVAEVVRDAGATALAGGSKDMGERMSTLGVEPL